VLKLGAARRMRGRVVLGAIGGLGSAISTRSRSGDLEGLMYCNVFTCMQGELMYCCDPPVICDLKELVSNVIFDAGMHLGCIIVLLYRYVICRNYSVMYQCCSEDKLQ
jgi:hypothetical protein